MKQVFLVKVQRKLQLDSTIFLRMKDIRYIRDIFTFGDISLIDNLIGASFERHLAKEIEPYLIIKSKNK